MKFKVGFDPRSKGMLFTMWDDILTSQKWAHGKYTRMFEEKWEEIVGLYSVAFNSWSGAAECAFDYYGIRNGYVMVPANTMVATARVPQLFGNRVIYVDCLKNDLCMSAIDLAIKSRVLKEKTGQWPSTVFLTHIGGHISFDVGAIQQFCGERGIRLLEDCAHAHGATWNGQAAGTYGSAGFYSFYATKTVSTGEGGMLVTGDPVLCEYAKKWRGYGKFSDGSEVPWIRGLNHRMSKFTAALGVVAASSLKEIVGWKNEYAALVLDPLFRNDHLKLPDGMISGLYKYIVFREIPNSTGKVYDAPVYRCSEPLDVGMACPNAEWVARNHWCVPLYYRGDEA